MNKRAFYLGPITPLTKDLLKVFKGVFCDTVYDRDELDMTTLLMLSKPSKPSKPNYRRILLFRDYSDRQQEHRIGKEKIYDQAITYFYEVFGHRLAGINAVQDRLTQMHKVFLALLRYSKSSGCWADADIRRSKNPTINVVKSLEPLAARAQCLRETIGEDVSPASRHHREKFGPYWLFVGQSAVELPDEMSLFDVFPLLPLPLDPSFADDHDIWVLLFDLLKSLNERYGVLRSVGLNPEIYLKRGELSISTLRKLKALRWLAQEKMRSGVYTETHAAYRDAFDELKGPQKKYAGFETFDEFCRTDYGQKMMGYTTLSINDSHGQDDDDWDSLFVDTEANNPEEEVSVIERLTALVSSKLEFQKDELLKRFVLAAIQGTHLGIEILDDPEMQALIRAHPRYHGLPQDVVFEDLKTRALDLIEKCIRETRNDDWR